MNDSQKFHLLDVFANFLYVIRGEKMLECASEIIKYALVNKKLNEEKSLLIRSMVQSICGKLQLAVSKGIEFGKRTMILIEYLLRNNLVEFISKWFMERQKQLLYRRFPDFEYDDKADISESTKLAQKRSEENENNMEGNKEKKKSGSNKNKIDEEEIIRFKIDPNCLFNEVQEKILRGMIENLKILLDINCYRAKYLKTTIGYSLLTLDGKFIWADKKSCDALDIGKCSEEIPPNQEENAKKNGEVIKEEKYEIEIKEKGKKKEKTEKQKLKYIDDNFFEKIIPPSMYYLNWKNEKDIFSNLKILGESRNFSYVIFSKKSKEKYITFCKKKIKNELNERLKNEDKDKKNPKSADDYKIDLNHRKFQFQTKNNGNKKNELFNRYMNALSSRATLVNLKYSRGDIEKIIEMKTGKINVSKDLLKSLAQKRSFDRFNRDSQESVGSGQFVLLETQLSSFIPEFKYEKMRSNSEIKEFEKDVFKKLDRHKNKVIKEYYYPQKDKDKKKKLIEKNPSQKVRLHFYQIIKGNKRDI